MLHGTHRVGLLFVGLGLAFVGACSGSSNPSTSSSAIATANDDAASIAPTPEAGADDIPPDGDESLVGEVSCGSDPRVDTYNADLTKQGKVMSFHLIGSDPAPPASGNNTFVLAIKSATGEKVGGDLAVSLKMPDHGHSAPVKPTITWNEADGTFTIDPAYLFMAGVWRVEFDLSSGGMPVDSAVFYFCIEG